jgi:hypothetical protein
MITVVRGKQMTEREMRYFEAQLLSPCEIEARVAAARMDLTPKERRARPVVEALLAEEKSARVFVKCLKSFLKGFPL